MDKTASSILEISVQTQEAHVVNGKRARAVMIPFTAVSDGPFFFGKTIISGTDTQHEIDGVNTLSARYMLEGTDYTGAACRVFIENKGTFEKGFTPFIITDSSALSEWEAAELKAEVKAENGSVTIRVYRR